jgi:membrane-associated phospholipid phosphatase
MHGTDPDSSTERRAWVLAASCLVLAILLGIALHDVHGPTSIEARLFHHYTGFDHELHGLSIRPAKRWLLALSVAFGEPVVFVSSLVALGAVAAVHRRARAAVAAAVAPVIAVLLTDHVGKPITQRLHEAASSYPSGHSTAAAALALTAWLMVRHVTGAAPDRALTALLVAIPVATGVGVVLLHWHYPTDAIGGWAVGAGTVLTCWAALGIISRRGPGT